MSNTFTGTVANVGHEEKISDNFSKRVLVVENTEGKYPKTGVFEFVNKNMDALRGIQVGDVVNVHFEIDARQGRDGRWWPSIKGWKVEKWKG